GALGRAIACGERRGPPSGEAPHDHGDVTTELIERAAKASAGRQHTLTLPRGRLLSSATRHFTLRVRARSGSRENAGIYRRSRPHGRASSTRLNGVWVARRNRLKPPPATTTSRSRASPACAPTAGPCSDSE